MNSSDLSIAASGPSVTFPREHIPKQPVLSVASFTQYARCDIPSVLDAGTAQYVNRGCTALGLALQHARVGDGDEVLLPAYHCISMIEPVIWRGARPVFYRIRADTAIDLDDIESRLTAHTRAILVPHYFGFPQDMPRIRAFCDAHRILLIEDCAHAFFGAIGSAPVGSFGDYAIASAWKFFPIYDGGLLISRHIHLSDLELHSWGLRFQAKAMVNTLERAFEYQRLGVAALLLNAPLSLKDAILRQTRKKTDAPVADANADISSELGGWGFDETLVTRKMSIASRLIMTLASRCRIIRSRRHNFSRMLGALGHLPACRPLHASLPQGVVPQVFPLVFDDPERAFARLKKLGVPIIRFGEYLWKGMDPATCPVSTDLSRRVFQLPCHQELHESELEWMIGKVTSVSAQ